MRRKDRLLAESETQTILENGEYGVLSMVSPDGGAYGIPLNYCLVDDCIYFHCATEGQKLDCIKQNPTVSFCVVGNTELEPSRFTTRYESSIVNGIATEVFDQEKQAALEALITKYADRHLPEGLDYIKKVQANTRVLKIIPESSSGKARR